MAKGRPKKTTGKIVPEIKPPAASTQRELALPELADLSLATEGLFGQPSRLYQNGIPGGNSPQFSYIKYRFSNLYNGIMPFQTQQGFINVRDAVWLCQKAYFNVAVFRNAINTLVELSNTEIYLEGGNKQSQNFFNAWFKRINLWRLKDMFFRELFRSGNVFLFRVDGDISKSDALKLNQAYGANGNLQLPLRYILLNVADISALNTITYDEPQYYKILTPQQVKVLSKSGSKDDQEVYKNLPKAIKSYFDGAVGAPIPIDLSKLHTIFYQKQDYEPFAVPMGFAVLDDINLKLEFKKTDAVLARTVEYITLLVTTGSEQKPDGTGGVSQKSITALRDLFSKEQVGRVLVADWSTKMDWSIPDLSKALGPSKYETVNEDIAVGLMDIFFGEQRFANVVAKLKLFVEKINRVQEIFLTEFLQAEIKRVAELMNFKSYPNAEFVRVSLDDPSQMMRVYTQLLQLGILTPEDGVEAIATGELPDFDTLVDNQIEFKKFKDQGLFQPIMGGPANQMDMLKQTGQQQLDLQDNQQQHQKKMQSQQQKHDAANPPPAPPPAIHINTPGTKVSQPTGRPPGAKAPQTTKKISPVGTKASEQRFSMSKLIENIKLMDEVRDKFTIAYKKEHGIKRLTDTNQELIDQITKTLFENESVADWENKISDYAKEPVPPDIDKALEIEDISNEYEVSNDAAILLYHSKV